MSSGPSAEEIAGDARWLVQAIDPNAGMARLVSMDREAYRTASFLDDRMMGEPRTSHIMAWASIGAAPIERFDARWIFHIGHVGSTLIARLLGELEGVLSVREPRVLRDLNFFPSEVRDRFTPTVRALMSRSFAADQLAVVKATSFVSEIAPDLMAGAKGLYLYAGPGSYISGILAGENSRKELAGLADMRRQRLASRDIGLPQPRNEADAAAIGWACEMTSLEAAAGTNCLWADFDRILGDLQPSLRKIADHFGLAATDERLSEIANGPLLQRYSKATEHEYSPQLRRDLLAEAYARHRADIESALAMVERAAETAPLLRKALDRAEAES